VACPLPSRRQETRTLSDASPKARDPSATGPSSPGAPAGTDGTAHPAEIPRTLEGPTRADDPEPDAEAIGAARAEALRLSEAKLAGIVGLASDAIISVDASQRITLFNEGACHIFGYEAAEVIGQPLDLLIPARHRSEHRRHIVQFGESEVRSRRMGERQRLSGLRKDGLEFPAEASISKLDLEGERVYTVVLRDITERERALAAERFLAEAGEVLASSLDFDHTLTSLARLTVRSLADLCAVDLLAEKDRIRRLQVAHGSDELGSVARELESFTDEPARPFLSGEVLRTGRAELWNGHPEDESRLGGRRDPKFLQRVRGLGIRSFMVVPLRAPERLLGALVLVETGRRARSFDERDLELAKELGIRAGLAVENARLYREANRAIQARDDILGVVSHDLGNPLQAIFIGLEALEKTRQHEGETGEDYYLSAIRKSAELMQRLIQELLEVRRMEEGHLSLEPRPEALPDLVHEALEVIGPLARVKSVTLIDETAGADLPTILVDGPRIQQVLSNLLGNAVKHTPPGGTVRILGESSESELRVSVEDSGGGIPEDQRERVFDRFWRAEATGGQGIGLGLAIAQGIVRAHGGRIWLESRIGEGSTFSFTIPHSGAG